MSPAATPAPTTSPSIDAPCGRDPAPRLAWPFVVLMGIAGAAVRIYLLTAAIGRPDSDELIAGLMAQNIGRDGLPLFFWGQHYEGTIETIPVALSMRVLGDSVVALRVPSLVLATISSILVWRVATRLLPGRGAALAGLLSWVGAPPALWLGTREMLSYAPTVLCGLVAALCAMRWREQGRRRDRTVMIAMLLLGFWVNPSIVYFAVPAVVVAARPTLERFVRRHRDRAVRFTRRRIGAVTIAALVVLFASASLVISYPQHLWHLFAEGLPGLLGFREMFTYRWILGPIGALAYLATLALIVVGLVRGWRAQGWHRPGWDTIGLLAFPFLFAAVPKVNDDPNLRYLFFAVPFVVMPLARIAVTRRWQPYVAATLALALTLLSFQRLYVVSEVERAVRVGNVGDLTEVRRVLDADHIDAVYGSYWVDFRLVFESDERIIAAGPFDEPRYQRYEDLVRASPRPAWVVEAGAQRDALRAALDAIGVGATEQPAGDFVVVIPDRLVRPEELTGPIRAL